MAKNCELTCFTNQYSRRKEVYVFKLENMQKYYNGKGKNVGELRRVSG